jgi:hypothetical protein
MQHIDCIFGCYAIIRDITHCLTQPVRVQGNNGKGFQGVTADAVSP